MKDSLDILKDIILEAEPVYATEKNTSSVRHGLELGGYIKYYKVPRYIIVKVKNHFMELTNE